MTGQLRRRTSAARAGTGSRRRIGRRGGRRSPGRATGERRRGSRSATRSWSPGRRPATDGLGLQELGVQTDKKGFVTVEKKFRTNVLGVYAIGDVIGGVMLAYKAEEEGIAAVEMMVGKPGTSTTTTTPPSSTSPRIGRRSATLRRTRWRRGTRCGSASSSPPTVARAMGEPDGQVKVIADAKTDRSSACAHPGAHAST